MNTKNRYTSSKVGTFFEVFDNKIKQTVHVTEARNQHIIAMAWFKDGKGEQFLRDNYTG